MKLSAQWLEKELVKKGVDLDGVAKGTIGAYARLLEMRGLLAEAEKMTAEEMQAELAGRAFMKDLGAVRANLKSGVLV